MTDADDLAARLRRLEDERDIERLIASYGWLMEGREAVHAMVSSQAHQKLVTKGCCHFLGPCVVTVTGDSAVAVCESLVLVRDGDGYRVWRCTANHFALRRIDGRWRIGVRTSRVLDGNPDAHALLTNGLAGSA